MQVAVIGASGRTGRFVVEIAIGRGMRTVAVVRDPTRLFVQPNPLLSTVKADARDAAELEPALNGSDAVIFAVGPRGPGCRRVQADGVRACLAAMRAVRIGRIVAVSGAWVANRNDGPFSRFVVKPLYRRALKNSYLDMVDMEHALSASAMNWTVLRPPVLTNGRPRHRYRSRLGRDVPFGLSITRGDLAEALLDVIADQSSFRTAVGVAR
jgi:putative NADH-flavin reductase